ncbi:MntH Mn2+ and Fe2+ transporter of the NRAMP family [Pyrenophora tritici-repentis]|uniref:MntH, Mn2+ and Fe2+ transporter NRAMP family n=1 Tax=Pyrenophora tritici-repentis TaxID=45151 RepID=A0A2W1E8T8_9PLEO|nr:transporter protein smf2 [Pyrenophora tritici-repentis]KAF7448250.1 transporter protein smf2 [Pyrenophora tritici-repentis]KAF7571966.1 MntH, Mn2+ and Fe2+ transporter NRAMP family [Pyrenophora tritici-repentis]KAG9384849.1 transporter protein smf2 [Pyrenophora tritici-repentis]KAI0585545.1 transporter protein smf2 [Pyrenophora tritici-repentis]
MNCPSRVDPEFPEGYNQNPNALNADATTRADLGFVANERARDGRAIDCLDKDNDIAPNPSQVDEGSRASASKAGYGLRMRSDAANNTGLRFSEDITRPSGTTNNIPLAHRKGVFGGTVEVVRKYLTFVGPGFMVAVAYIDPGNYATDIAAGASFEYKLLFVVLMSNIFAIFLQSLCIKLGSVTGMNLAENCRAHLPLWLNYVLYFFAESAIIATDIAEVIGTAIALNILLHIPLVAGCAISILDVLIILLFYSPSGTMAAIRGFEIFVALLVLGVVVCFCFELSKVHASAGEVLHGYVPSSTLIKSQALYQACGILGATVMPHSLYLGSGIVQPRLREYDDNHNSTSFYDEDTGSLIDELKYKPSLAAIKHCMSYSIIELTISLFTFALFVNSAIVIVAGASLYGQSEAADADLFSIHSLLSRSVAPAAGTLFALALLLSGLSAGIVCTIAGQMVSEGQLNWTIKPWIRRLITRSISITPSIIIAGAVGREGLSQALNGSQVALSVILPFVSAPLIWFTCRSRYMKVAVRHDNDSPLRTAGSAGVADHDVNEHVQMRNHWLTAAFAVLIWGVIVVMNVAALVFAGMGIA